MGICCASYCRDDSESFIDNNNGNSFSSTVPVVPAIVSETTSYYEDYQENLRKARQNASHPTTSASNLPDNENGAPQILTNQPTTNTNFNTQFEASTFNGRDTEINLILANENPENNLNNIEADAKNKNQINFLNGSRLESIGKETNFLESLTQQEVVRNLELINDLRAAFNLNNLKTFPESPYQEEDLEALQYVDVANFFKMSNKPYFTISKITAVTNIFLELHFELNMEIYRKRNPEQSVDSSLLFHGTKHEFLDRICTYNFDRTKVCTHKFGHGVSFARHASYATHYHYDNKRKYQKVMIIAKALVEPILPIGTHNTVVPPEPYYTSRNKNASVIVKYDDASFYPLFIVYYTGFHPQDSYKKRH